MEAGPNVDETIPQTTREIAEAIRTSYAHGGGQTIFQRASGASLCLFPGAERNRRGRNCIMRKRKGEARREGKVGGRFGKFVLATSFNWEKKKFPFSLIRFFGFSPFFFFFFFYVSLLWPRVIEEIISYEQSSVLLNFQRWTFNEFLEKKKVYNFFDYKFRGFLLEIEEKSAIENSS